MVLGGIVKVKRVAMVGRWIKPSWLKHLNFLSLFDAFNLFWFKIVGFILLHNMYFLKHREEGSFNVRDIPSNICTMINVEYVK